ncbi:hypothetical protein [Streptomyces sp. NPDC088725]|uniref:hypothetical protein n=1 Tax=Streptomyces sp. NPDC088725 TaxID=3365873 RepID=UPI0037F150D7
MSVTDHRRRRLGIAAATALLPLAVAGCSGLGRTAGGPLTYETPQKHHMQVTRIPVGGCHKLSGPGAAEVTNLTLVDVILYQTPDCTGSDTTYLATTLSDHPAPGQKPWHSYTVVH